MGGDSEIKAWMGFLTEYHQRPRAAEREQHMEQIEYTRVGDYLLPNIVLKPTPPEYKDKPLGGYARRRRAFLKEHRPILYNQLLLTERLYPHLREIDEAAAHRMAVIADREQAQEIISELIYE